MISPVQSHCHEGSPMSKEVKLRWEGFVEKVGFEPGVSILTSDKNSPVREFTYFEANRATLPTVLPSCEWKHVAAYYFLRTINCRVDLRRKKTVDLDCIINLPGCLVSLLDSTVFCHQTAHRMMKQLTNVSWRLSLHL